MSIHAFSVPIHVMIILYLSDMWYFTCGGDKVIEKMAKKLAYNYVDKKMIEEADEEVCVYGLELLISSMISIGVVLAISIVYSRLIQGMVYLIAYCTLRSYSGGYHADTHMKCISTFVGSFVIILNFVKYVDFLWSFYICILLLFCNVIIFLLAPIDATNNPISLRSKGKMKEKARGCIISFTLIALTLWLIGLQTVAEFMVMGMFLCTILVLVGSLKNTIWRKRYENVQEIS